MYTIIIECIWIFHKNSLVGTRESVLDYFIFTKGMEMEVLNRLLHSIQQTKCDFFRVKWKYELVLLLVLFNILRT